MRLGARVPGTSKLLAGKRYVLWFVVAGLPVETQSMDAAFLEQAVVATARKGTNIRFEV